MPKLSIYRLHCLCSINIVFFSLILFNNLIIKPSWKCKYEHLWSTIYFTFRYIKVWNYIFRICFVVASLILLHFFLKLFCTKSWWNWKNSCLQSTTVNSTFGYYIKRFKFGIMCSRSYLAADYQESGKSIQNYFSGLIFIVCSATETLKN